MFDAIRTDYMPPLPEGFEGPGGLSNNSADTGYSALIELATKFSVVILAIFIFVLFLRLYFSLHRRKAAASAAHAEALEALARPGFKQTYRTGWYAAADNSKEIYIDRGVITNFERPVGYGLVKDSSDKRPQ